MYPRLASSARRVTLNFGSSCLYLARAKITRVLLASISFGCTGDKTLGRKLDQAPTYRYDQQN